jgi:hypothetical protein
MTTRLVRLDIQNLTNLAAQAKEADRYSRENLAEVDDTTWHVTPGEARQLFLALSELLQLRRAEEQANSSHLVDDEVAGLAFGDTRIFDE